MMKTFLTAFLAAVGLAEAATEIAPYEVLRQDGAFEVRQYPQLVLVETDGSQNEMNNNFRRLFRYISGSNQAEQKIPMTAPVFTEGREEGGKMAFVMPVGMPEEKTPRPADSSLAVREQAAGRFAVYRFSGWTSVKGEKEAAAKLDEWVRANGLEKKGEVIFAYYDPPWTLPMFRRNEAMVLLADQ